MEQQKTAALPQEIERRSFAIITKELGDRVLDPDEAPIIKRVIHTTADFDYAQSLVFANGAVAAGLAALGAGASIVTDTQMARAGINKAALAALGGEALCFMGDEDVAQAAREQGTTRSSACMDKAALAAPGAVFVVGNAPTALLRLCTLLEEGRIHPSLIIGVPVGFVNVVESKERLLTLPVPAIVARGRKGGSNVAAAICNALLYRVAGRII